MTASSDTSANVCPHALGVEIPPWKLIRQQFERPTTLDPKRLEAAAKLEPNEIPTERLLRWLEVGEQRNFSWLAFSIPAKWRRSNQVECA